MLLGLFQNTFQVGSLAWRANLFTAIATLAALQLTLWLLRELGATAMPALVATLTFAVSRIVWSEATVTEVYPVHAVFMAATLLSLVRFGRQPTAFRLFVACAAYAASFGTHMTTALLLPVFVTFVFAVGRPEVTRPRNLAIVIAIICVAASQYGYLFWATKNSPYVESEVRTFSDLIHVATGAQFSGRFFGVGFSRLVAERLPLAFQILSRDVGWLAIVSLACIPRPRASLFLIAGFTISHAVFAVGYDIPDIEAYFIPVEMGVVVLGGLGLTGVLEMWPRQTRSWAAGALLLIPIALGLVRFEEMNRSDDDSLARETTSLIEQAGSRAVLLSPSYETSEALWYYLLGEHMGDRLDVHVVHHVSLPEIHAYLLGRGRIWLPEERRFLPPGLTVYAIGPTWDASYGDAALAPTVMGATSLRRLEVLQPRPE